MKDFNVYFYFQSTIRTLYNIPQLSKKPKIIYTSAPQKG